MKRIGAWLIRVIALLTLFLPFFVPYARSQEKAMSTQQFSIPEIDN